MRGGSLPGTPWANRCRGAAGHVGEGRSLRRPLLVVSLLAALLGGASAVAAPRLPARLDGCGGVVSVRPERWYHSYHPPLAIGDSTMLLALPQLSREEFSANAHGCRQYPEALALLRGLVSARALPRVVVIALGANGEITDGDVLQALHILGPGRLLVLLTPRELGGGAGADAALVRTEGRRHPQRVLVLDWVAYSAGHPEWFEGDGLHLTPAGSTALARLIGRAGPLAEPPKSRSAPRCPAGEAGPPWALAGVTLTPAGGALRPDARTSLVHVTVTNANASAVVGVGELREAAPGRQTLATACISAPAGASATVALALTPATRADLSIRRHVRVRVELTLAGPQGMSGALAGTYLLTPPGER